MKALRFVGVALLIVLALYALMVLYLNSPLSWIYD